MNTRTQKKQQWALASVASVDAFTDFILSRQAMLCSPNTISWYQRTAGFFISWLEKSGITRPDEITARHVRTYLSELADRGLKDSSINGYARAIRTLVRFFAEEGYSSEIVKFKMPAIAKKRLPLLSQDEARKVISKCNNPRDLALIFFMLDTGIRRAELCALNWEHLDIASGLVRIEKGKGGKFRSVVIGINARRAMLRYRRVVSHNEKEPLFQARGGNRISNFGLRSILLRIGARAEIKLSPHMLRRSFATFAARKMNVIHLSALMGHASLDMTRHYLQLLDTDLIEAHAGASPVDGLL